jgi:hypothetical protein
MESELMSLSLVVWSVIFVAIVAGERILENAHLALTGDLSERFGSRQMEKFTFLGQ